MCFDDVSSDAKCAPFGWTTDPTSNSPNPNRLSSSSSADASQPRTMAVVVAAPARRAAAAAPCLRARCSPPRYIGNGIGIGRPPRGPPLVGGWDTLLLLRGAAPQVDDHGRRQRRKSDFSFCSTTLAPLVLRHQWKQPRTAPGFGAFHGAADGAPLPSYTRGVRAVPMTLLGNASHHWNPQSRHHRRQQQRLSSSSSSWLPEAMQDFTIWGGSGYVLKLLHGAPPAGSVVAAGGGAAADASTSAALVIPYWACFALISLGVRFALVPLVLQGAHTSSRFAKVVPEVQFLLSLFGADRKKQLKDGAPFSHRLALLRTNFQTLSGIYRLHKIHPLAVFWSPLVQLPVFWYVSIDLRKIVNGLDPLLAQDLVEAGVGWIPDLTEPDPWFGLPVLAGLLMYANVEVALGRRSLSGPAAAKSETALVVKDVFQCFAVFMPCFTSQLPGGVQIYLVTSFAFTCAQSAALRTESIRKMVGLPSMLAPPSSMEAPKYAQEFIELKKLEQRAIEMRGDGPVLGKGVLAANFQVSFPGERRPSTIKGSGMGAIRMAAAPPGVLKPNLPSPLVDNNSTPFIHGVSAPAWQVAEQRVQQQESETETVQSVPLPPDEREYMPVHSDAVMEKANRGEMPVAPRIVPRRPDPAAQAAAARLSMKRLKKSTRGSGSAGSKR